MANVEWIAIKFGIDIHGPQSMNPTTFGDLLTFPLAPIFVVLSEISQLIMDGPNRMNYNHYGDPLTFPLVSSSSQKFI